MDELSSDRLPTFSGFNPSLPARTSAQDDRLTQHLQAYIKQDSKRLSSQKAAESRLVKRGRAKQRNEMRLMRDACHIHKKLFLDDEKEFLVVLIIQNLHLLRNKNFRDYLTFGRSCSTTPIYDVTALGLVCAATWTDTDKNGRLNVAPEQVQCSQHMVGHTPLRDAVRNPSCTPQVLSLLLVPIPTKLVKEQRVNKIVMALNQRITSFLIFMPPTRLIRWNSCSCFSHPSECNAFPFQKASRHKQLAKLRLSEPKQISNT